MTLHETYLEGEIAGDLCFLCIFYVAFRISWAAILYVITIGGGGGGGGALRLNN